jgi:Spy/CpxP family protein refolding chaperone
MKTQIVILKNSLAIGLMLLVNLTVQAQNEGGGVQRIENTKIALITNRLNLTPEQGQVFWPLYNEFDSKKKDIRKNYRKLVSEINTLTTTDEKILANLKETLSLQQKEVDLSKEYMARFLKIINVRQLAELYKTEQLFTNMLLQRLNKNSNKNLPD